MEPLSLLRKESQRQKFSRTILRHHSSRVGVKSICLVVQMPVLQSEKSQIEEDEAGESVSLSSKRKLCQQHGPGDAQSGC